MSGEREGTIIEGSLDFKPLVHLLLDALRGRWSGTLILDSGDRVLLQNGHPVAGMFVSAASSLEDGLLALCAQRDNYAFHPGSDHVNGMPAVWHGEVDPLAIPAAAARGGARDDAVKAFVRHVGEGTPIRLRARDRVKRLRLTSDERRLVTALQQGDLSIFELREQTRMSSTAVGRVVYVLLLTRTAATAPRRASVPPDSGERMSSDSLRLPINSMPPPTTSGLYDRPSTPPPDDGLPVEGIEEFRLAQDLMRERKWQPALLHLTLAIERNATEPDFQAALAYCMHCAHPGDNAPFSEILQALDIALSLNYEHIEAHYTKGLVLKRMGNEDKALIHFRKVAELDPSHIDARREVHLAEKRSRGIFGRLFGRTRSSVKRG